MASLSIKNETVYVIYHNGQPFSEPGRKLVYTTKGSANGVITEYCKENARRIFNQEKERRKQWNYEWYYLSDEEQKQRMDEVRKEFELVEYVPKKNQPN